jgi:hypothetical protein
MGIEAVHKRRRRGLEQVAGNETQRREERKAAEPQPTERGL